MAESINAPQTGDQFDKLSKKYPYLTAYVGFLALFALARMGIGLLFTVIFTPFESYFSNGSLALIVEVMIWASILIAGFYIFRYVIKKHILPPVNKS